MECTIKLEGYEPYMLSETTCPVNWAQNAIALYREQLCGKSLFCREGMAELYRIVEDIGLGKSGPEDLTLIRELCDVIARMVECEGAKAVTSGIVSTLDECAGVWEAHIKRKRCTALACSRLLTFYIDPAKCAACGDCARVCAPDAISGGEGLYYVIDKEGCTKCGDCYFACKPGAVTKAAAGAVLPKLPDKPGALGSFKSGLGGLRRGLRGVRP